MRITAKGLEHFKPRKQDGEYYLDFSINHKIILDHQNLFSSLMEKMVKNPNDASKIYKLFLCSLPYIIKQKYNEDIEKKLIKLLKI